MASLEILVHTEDTQVLASMQWVTIPVNVDEKLIEIAESPTRQLGTQWIAQARSVALRVPSIVVTGEYNYLINPRHQDFDRLDIGSAQPFSFDPRLT